MATELTSAEDLKTVIGIQLSSLSTLITADGYALVCDQVTLELGWSYPVTSPTKVLWMIKRGTRYAIELLRLAAASKFKFKQVNLQHRFDHYQKLIEDMDKEFETAMAADIGLFAGVDSFKMFGTKIDAGFAYTSAGEDITYDWDQYVRFEPSENS
jgi:hypothetical protein